MNAPAKPNSRASSTNASSSPERETGLSFIPEVDERVELARVLARVADHVERALAACGAPPSRATARLALGTRSALAARGTRASRACRGASAYDCCPIARARAREGRSTRWPTRWSASFENLRSDAFILDDCCRALRGCVELAEHRAEHHRDGVRVRARDVGHEPRRHGAAAVAQPVVRVTELVPSSSGVRSASSARNSSAQNMDCSSSSGSPPAAPPREVRALQPARARAPRSSARAQRPSAAASQPGYHSPYRRRRRESSASASHAPSSPSSSPSSTSASARAARPRARGARRARGRGERLVHGLHERGLEPRHAR